MQWLFFALLSRALYAAVNVVDKMVVEKYIHSPLVYFLVTALVSLVVLTIIPFRGIYMPSENVLVSALLAGATFVYGVLLYFYALKFDEASRVVPLWQITPLLTLLISFFTIGERLDTKDFIAFPFLIIGGFLLTARRIEGVLKISKAHVVYAVLKFTLCDIGSFGKIRIRAD